MPWLYLASSVAGAGLTWNLYRPRYVGSRLAAASFAAGLLTGELALFHVAWQALATLAFASAGAFDAWPGRLGLVVSLASWAGLAYALIEAHGAGTTARHALEGAFGRHYEDRILPEWRAKLGDSLDWRRALQPLPLLPRDVERVRDLRFARARGVDLRLDLYRPRSGVRRAPTLLQIHGGGWTTGRKDDHALPLLHHLAAHGWVCVSANYRLSPHATFPEHLVDVKCAVRWIRQNAAEYGADPDFLVATGGSAGGHLAALLALTPNDPEYQPGFENADTRVHACVPFYGIYDLADRERDWRHDALAKLLERSVMKASLDEAPREYLKASPIARIAPDAPPFFVIHGDRDTMAPVQSARRFVEALREKSKAPVAYAELRGAQHGFAVLRSARTQHVIQAVERFLAALYTEYRSSRLDALDDLDPPGS